MWWLHKYCPVRRETKNVFFNRTLCTVRFQRSHLYCSSQLQIKKKSLCFHQCSAVMQSCFTRAAGSGGCAGTGFWITTPCPSITSGEGCLETSTLHTNGTMAGSSSLKVRVRNYDSLFQPWRWEAEPPPIDHDVFVSTVLYENKRQ